MLLQPISRQQSANIRRLIMTKKPLLTSGALGITILLFNIFFFLLKEDLSLANTTLWISYGFLHFSAFAAIVVTFLPPQNVTYRFSLSSLSMVYFILEFLCGSFFMVFDGIHYKISLLVQLVLLAVCGIAALFFSTVNRTTEKQLNNDKQNKNVIQE